MTKENPEFRDGWLAHECGASYKDNPYTPKSVLQAIAGMIAYALLVRQRLTKRCGGGTDV